MKNIFILILILLGSTVQAVEQGTANQVMRVPGGGGRAKFGSIDLSQSAAVGSSILPFANGGSGVGTCASGGILYSTGSGFTCDNTKIKFDGSLFTIGTSGQAGGVTQRVNGLVDVYTGLTDAYGYTTRSPIAKGVTRIRECNSDCSKIWEFAADFNEIGDAPEFFDSHLSISSDLGNVLELMRASLQVAARNDGDASTPMFTFWNNKNTGLFNASGSLGITTGGAQRALFATNAVTLTGTTTVQRSIGNAAAPHMIIKDTNGNFGTSASPWIEFADNANTEGADFGFAGGGSAKDFYFHNRLSGGTIIEMINSVVLGTWSSTGLLVAATLQGKGVTDGGNASAGYLGEYKEAHSTSDSNIGTTNQYATISGPLALTAGDWKIDGQVRMITNGATFTNVVDFCIGTADGNSSAGCTAGTTATAVGVSTTGWSSAFVTTRVSVSGSTSYYLKLWTTYTGGPPQQDSQISAVRIR